MQSKVAIMIKSMKKAFFFVLLKKNDYVGSMSLNEKIVLDKSMFIHILANGPQTNMKLLFLYS